MHRAFYMPSYVQILTLLSGIRLDSQSALDHVKSHPALSHTPVVSRDTSLKLCCLFRFHAGALRAINRRCRRHRPRKPKPKLRSSHHHSSPCIPYMLNLQFPQIKALVLENTFLSLPRLIPSAMPWLARVSFLCHQKWDSASKVPLLPRSLPVLMLSGAQDEVVPSDHMRELERLLRNEDGQHGQPRRPGTFIEFPEGNHSACRIANSLTFTVPAHSFLMFFSSWWALQITRARSRSTGAPSRSLSRVSNEPV